MKLETAKFEFTAINDNGVPLDEDGDPIDYWKTCTKYPALADYALDLLVVPCSSSPSETLFSHAGILSLGVKSPVSERNLEKQVLLKTNYTIMLSVSQSHDE